MLVTERGTQANVAIKHKNYTTMHEEWHNSSANKQKCDVWTQKQRMSAVPYKVCKPQKKISECS